MFITFEGIDGAGKSSHIKTVADAVSNLGLEVVLTREPGGTALGESLRALALNEPMDSLTEALVMFASRREHIKRVIEPALNRGAVVISDRFTDSTFAYQGGGRGFPLETLSALERMVQKLDSGEVLQPDLTFWFRLDPDVAARRLVGARDPDKFESMQRDFFEKVSQGYQARMNQAPSRFAVVDAAASIEEVRSQVAALIASRVLVALPSLRREANRPPV